MANSKDIDAVIAAQAARTVTGSIYEPTDIKMTPFDAAMIADGEFELTSFEPSEENYLAAYQYLVDTGMAWTLQGRVGREAARLIADGQIEAKT